MTKWTDNTYYAYTMDDLRLTDDAPEELSVVEEDSDTPDEWPYPTVTTRYRAAEGMARDIRKRASLPDDTEVIVVEDGISGGYSEYTQEDEYPLTIEAGNFTREFDSLQDLIRWVETDKKEN